MTDIEKPDITDVLRAEKDNSDLRGIYRDSSGQLIFDCRYTVAAILRGQQVAARTIELWQTKLDMIPLSEELAVELGYNGGQDGTINTTL